MYCIAADCLTTVCLRLVRQIFESHPREKSFRIGKKITPVCFEPDRDLSAVEREEKFLFSCRCFRVAHICHFLSENGNVFNIYKGKKNCPLMKKIRHSHAAAYAN